MTLRATNLVGFGAGGGPSPFKGLVGNQAASNTNSISVSFDTSVLEADADLYLIAAIACYDNDVADSTFGLSSPTIDAVAASTVVEASADDASNKSVYSAIIIANVPSPGATASVEFTFGGFAGTVDNIYVSLYAAVLDSGTALDTDAGTASATIDTTGASFSILSASDYTSDPGTITGGGNPTTDRDANKNVIGHDDAPPGGSTTYDATSGTDIYVAACW